jgi:hypothetical protein
MDKKLQELNDNKLFKLDIRGNTCSFISFSLHTGKKIGTQVAIKLFEALKSNSSLTKLNLFSNSCSFISFSLHTDNDLGEEAAIELSEALKTNTSLTSLNISCNKLAALFHSHSTQVITLMMKEYQISQLFHLFSLNTGTKIGTKGAIKFSELLKLNSPLTELELYCITCCFFSFSLMTANDIDNAGAIKLAEVLMSNSSLTSLGLSGNKLFHFILTQYS